MSELAKAYEPVSVEKKWYAAWTEKKAFAARVNPEKDPYCIMIPPPNVTGMLHMGHILNNTLQDIFTRRARLEGKEALWYPGTDHAGIATQTRVEKKLRAEGKTRHDLGRDKFLEAVWSWKEEHGGIILNQLKQLGASCDWDRTSFTLDDHYAKAVLNAFVELYRRGHIYRGRRMGNWCPVSQTALSNEEVIMKPQKGSMYKMRYELVDSPGHYLEISTTRPETIPGDTAVAVHPEDERYQHLIGRSVWRPFPKAAIPIIGDTAVQREFGTGALKVTPAHDPVDYEIGLRHKLPVVDVLNPDGTLNEHAGPDLAGMERFAARKRAVTLLEESGLLIETTVYENNVGYSERADVPVEPRLTEQWWLKYPKVGEAKRAVTSGILRFHPKRWEKVYLHWLEAGQQNNIDWCLSRQLWWGHRIPVWYNKNIARAELDWRNPGHVHVSVEGPSDPENWEQDPDVLDTWASSWLWPFANFGWPDAHRNAAASELKYFYPTSVLVTGFDIIFLWVARMVMAGLEFMGDEQKQLSDEEIAARIPFRDVFITGLIRDAKRRKMSKSLGNSPDPLDLIAKFGADGLRFGIVNIAPSGQDILFSEDRIEIGRNFCNKLWNACRFRQMNGNSVDNGDLDAIAGRMDPASLDRYDHWILQRLQETTDGVAKAFAEFEMHPYPHLLYEFFWNDYCDWYVEASKTKLRDPATRETALAVQDFVLRQVLMLLHPIIPFITEELWNGLGFREHGTEFMEQSRMPDSTELRSALAAKGIQVDEQAVQQIAAVKETIVRLRALKSEYNAGNRRDVKLNYTADAVQAGIVEANRETLQSLAGLGDMTPVASAPSGQPAVVTSLGTWYLDLASSLDVAAERERLGKELAKLEKAITASQARLANDKFVGSAPPEIVQGARDQLSANLNKQAELQRLLASL